MTIEPPIWLKRAWTVRAVLLSCVIGLLALMAAARWGLAEQPLGLALGALCFAVLLAVALYADWLWLQRNHHRVNSWGLSKGKDARKRPK